jgi:hypothetical protein
MIVLTNCSSFLLVHSPGVLKVRSDSGAWATHAFNVVQNGDSVKCREIELVIDEGHTGCSFTVMRNIRVLGEGGSSSPGRRGKGLSGRLGVSLTGGGR